MGLPIKITITRRRRFNTTYLNRLNTHGISRLTTRSLTLPFERGSGRIRLALNVFITYNNGTVHYNLFTTISGRQTLRLNVNNLYRLNYLNRRLIVTKLPHKVNTQLTILRSTSTTNNSGTTLNLNSRYSKKTLRLRNSIGTHTRVNDFSITTITRHITPRLIMSNNSTNRIVRHNNTRNCIIGTRKNSFRIKSNRL